MTRKPQPPLPSPRSASERRRAGNGRFAKDPMSSERAARGMQLSIEGYTWQQIADQCGYPDRGTARHEVYRHMSQAHSFTQKAWRKKELARLEDLTIKVYSALLTEKKRNGETVTDEDGEPVMTTNLFAVDRLVALMDRRAKLLGIDLKTEGSDSATVVSIREYQSGILEAMPLLPAQATMQGGAQ